MQVPAHDHSPKPLFHLLVPLIFNVIFRSITVFNTRYRLKLCCLKMPTALAQFLSFTNLIQCERL